MYSPLHAVPFSKTIFRNINAVDKFFKKRILGQNHFDYRLNNNLKMLLYVQQKNSQIPLKVILLELQNKTFI